MARGKSEPSWGWSAGKGYTTLQLMLTRAELTPTGWEGLKMRPLPAATPTRNVLSSHDVKVDDSCPARDINMGCAGRFFYVSLHRPQHTPYSTFQGLSKPWLSNSGPHLYVCVVHTGRWRRLHPNWFTWAMLPRKTCQERKPERDARQCTYRREIHSAFTVANVLGTTLKRT